MIRITQGNDVTLCVPLVSKDTTGRYTPIPASDVESLTVSVTSGGQEVDSSWWSKGTQSNLVLINLSESFALGHYAITITGVYQDKDIRWASPNAFRIVQYNEQSTALNHLSLARQTIDSAVFIAAVATEGGGGSEEDEINSYNWVHFIEAANTAFDLGFTEATDFTAAIEAFENYIEAHSGDDAVISPETLNAILDLFEGLTGETYSAADNDTDNVTVKNRISGDLSTAWGNLVSAVNSLAGAGTVSTSSTIGDVATALSGVTIPTSVEDMSDWSAVTSAVYTLTGVSVSSKAEVLSALQGYHPTPSEWAGIVSATGASSSDVSDVNTAITGIKDARDTAQDNEAYIKDKADNLTGDSGSETTRTVADHLTSQFSTLAGTIASKTGSTAPTTLGGANTAVSGLPSVQDLATSQGQTYDLLEPVNVLTGGKPNQGGNYSRSEAQAAATALSNGWQSVEDAIDDAASGSHTSNSYTTTSAPNVIRALHTHTSEISSATPEITLANNTIFNCASGTPCTGITISFPASVPTNFISQINFTSGSGSPATTITINGGATIDFDGDACSGGAFTPVASKRYLVLITNDGTDNLGFVVENNISNS